MQPAAGLHDNGGTAGVAAQPDTQKPKPVKKAPTTGGFTFFDTSLTWNSTAERMSWIFLRMMIFLVPAMAELITASPRFETADFSAPIAVSIGSAPLAPATRRQVGRLPLRGGAGAPESRRRRPA